MATIVDKRSFALGMVLAGGFAAVLAPLFAPMVGGKTGLVMADEFFNGLAKGSTCCIDELRDQAGQFDGHQFSAVLEPKGDVRKAESLCVSCGCQVSRQGKALHVRGDLGKLAAAALADAEDMYFNRGQEVSARRGMDERQALYGWWTVLEQLDKNLRTKPPAQADHFCQRVMTDAVEPGYNFYGVKPEKASDHPVKIAALLGFYVLYTVWFGCAIYFIFKGLGVSAARTRPSAGQSSFLQASRDCGGQAGSGSRQ